MTGLLKFIAVGAVTAFSALTALRLSRIKNNFQTRIGMPFKADVIKGQLQLTFPVTIFNYTGEDITIKRLRSEIKYTPKGGTETTLGISPKIVPELSFKKDDVSTPSITVEFDPAAFTGLKADTALTINVKFSYGLLPVVLPTTRNVGEFIPDSAIDIIKTLLHKFGLGKPALGCACQPALPPYNTVKALSGLPANTLTEVL